MRFLNELSRFRRHQNMELDKILHINFKGHEESIWKCLILWNLWSIHVKLFKKTSLWQSFTYLFLLFFLAHDVDKSSYRRRKLLCQVYKTLERKINLQVEYIFFGVSFIKLCSGRETYQLFYLWLMAGEIG